MRVPIPFTNTDIQFHRGPLRPVLRGVESVFRHATGQAPLGPDRTRTPRQARMVMEYWPRDLRATGRSAPSSTLRVATPRQLVERAFKLVSHAGRPDFGTVWHFEQMHPHASQNADPALRAAVVQSQQDILDGLLGLGVKHVFSESCLGTYHFDDASPTLVAHAVRASFSSYQPAAVLRPDQQALLFEHGGDAVYGWISRGVTMHATADRQIEQDAQRHASEHGDRLWSTPRDQWTDIDQETIFERREVHAVGRMREHFQHRPGSEIALTFGAAHDFSSYCDRSDFRPVFRSNST